MITDMMCKILMQKLWGITLLLLVVSSALAQKKDKYDPKKTDKTIAEFKKQDPEIKKYFDSAHGYVVFPSIGKGAFGVGGAAGKGVVYENGTPMGGTNMTQVTVGFQLGGQKYSEVIFFENEESFERFIENDFEFAAQASAVALSSGASANASYKGGVLVFTMAKGGLMYEASVGGQKFKFVPFD